MDPGRSNGSGRPAKGTQPAVDGPSPVVLVCPLDWGLGHAARSVSLIRAFREEGARVIVAADGDALAFLRQCFRDGMEFRVLAGKPVVYPRSAQGYAFAAGLIRQLPGLIRSVRSEHVSLRRLIRETGAGIVVSDNRYGLYASQATCIFVGHQIHLRAPRMLRLGQTLVNRLNHWLISRFDHCWVPDHAGPDNLSGELSHPCGERRSPKSGNMRFIGPLSRFAALAGDPADNPLPARFPDSFYLVMLSGPEPQRSLLEEELNRQLPKLAHAVVVMRGLVGEDGTPQKKKSQPVDPQPGDPSLPDPLLPDLPPVVRFEHLEDAPLAWLIRHARLVICRPGYSTLMDLAVFGKKAVVIPTPGQTEQEYLGERMEKMGWVCCIPQTGLNLSVHVEMAEDRPGIPRLAGGENLLREAVRGVLGRTGSVP